MRKRCASVFVVGVFAFALTIVGACTDSKKAEEVRKQVEEFTATTTPELGEAIANFNAEIGRRRVLLDEYLADLRATNREPENDDTYGKWSSDLDSIVAMRDELETKRNDLYLDYKRQKLEPDGEAKEKLEAELKQAKVLAVEKMRALRALNSPESPESPESTEPSEESPLSSNADVS